ncbi:hypothetical protein, partial [Helicobacter burdigaliensis]|uniref:hypothetical protein n=1 Tax=Helicobacter burdigaliensis TaxID=2315334 RepID=UPI001300785D
NEELKKPSGNVNEELHLVGNNVFINADSSYIKSDKINLTATNKAEIQRTMIDFAEDDYNFYKNIQGEIVKADYKDYTNNTTSGKDFQKIVTLGNMGDEKKNAIEWWYFANGWNYHENDAKGKGDIRSIDEFRLVGDIDFSGNKGEGKVGKDWQNYANYCIEGLGCASMIVGSGINDAFRANFDGQGYTLKNINIDTTITGDYKPKYVGIFGYIDGGEFKNINVDYMGGGAKMDADMSFIGGFAGYIDKGTFLNIVLNNIKNIESDNSFTGGFAGSTDGNFKNINLSNIGNIKGRYAGGFAGVNYSGGVYQNISLSDLKKIESEIYAGGFMGEINGYGIFSNIQLDDIENICGYDSGGFVGEIYGGSNLSSITLNNIGNISSKGSSGGFIGIGYGGTFSNIVLNNIGSISGIIVGGFAGSIEVDITFENIYIYFNPNATIQGKENAGKFVGEIYNNNASHVFEIVFNNVNLYYADSQFQGLEDIGYEGGNVTITGKITSIKDKTHDEFIQAVLEDKALKEAGIYQDDKGNLSFFEPLDNGNGSNGDNNNDSGFKDENGDGLNDVILTKDDFSPKILEEILGNLNFNLLEIKTEEDIRAIKQTLEFLLAFIGSDGLEQLGIFSKFDLANKNLANEITQEKINNLYNALLKNQENIQKINAFNQKFQEYMKEYNTYLTGLEEWLKPQLEAKYKELISLRKDMEESYNKLQGDIGTIFTLNKDYKALANNNNVRFNLASLNLIPLIPNVDKDDNQKITSPLKDINASMINKEKIVLVKPAEEEKEALDEEKGTLNSRTCVVSENFKTNNPCMAERI